MKKKKLVLYVRGPGEYADFLTTAKFLVEDYDIVIISEISVEKYGHSYLRQKAEALGCDCYDLSQEIKAAGKIKILWILLKNGIITIPMVLYITLSNLLRLRFDRIRLPYYAFYPFIIKSLLHKILVKESPSVLLINNVNGGNLGELAITSAREIGIKSILIPYTFISPVAPARVLAEQPRLQIKGYKLRKTLKYFPKWFYHYNNKEILRKPLFFVFSAEFLKVSPPKPWIQDSSTADVMIAESEFMKMHYERLGIIHNNIQVIGKPNHDYLHSLYANKDSLIHKLHEELEFEQERPFLLLAIPPRFIGFREREGRASEFTDYDEIVTFLLDTMSHIKNFNVLICLHPRERTNIMEQVFRKDTLPSHMKYSMRDTAELMSVSELYIMAGSSTALWALTLKIPVVDYDVYGFQFDFFARNPDVMKVTQKKAFQVLLTQVDEIPDFLKHRKEILHEKNDHYGRLDGKSVNRLKKIINNIAN